MPDPSYPTAEESLHRLHRSGWSCGEATFTGSSGRTVWQVDGSNGENRITVHGASPEEGNHYQMVGAWSPAVGRVKTPATPPRVMGAGPPY
jgi:hypothetical protein